MQVNPKQYAAPDVFSHMGESNSHAPQDAPRAEDTEAAGTDKFLKSSANTQKDDAKKIGGVSASGNSFEIQPPKPKDSSSALIQRLVGATGQFEVRQIISEASSSLINLRVAAALCKGKDAELAKAYIAKLEKLIRRAKTKIRDLDNEDDMKMKSARAERQKLKKRAEQIKEELRNHILKRKRKENNYLIEDMHDKLFTGASEDTATEAELTAQAEAMAAAEMSAGGQAFSDSFAAGTESTGIDASSGAGADAAVSADAGGAGAEVSVSAE